jgi:hypothetical protein
MHRERSDDKRGKWDLELRGQRLAIVGRHERKPRHAHEAGFDVPIPPVYAIFVYTHR